MFSSWTASVLRSSTLRSRINGTRTVQLPLSSTFVGSTRDFHLQPRRGTSPPLCLSKTHSSRTHIRRPFEGFQRRNYYSPSPMTFASQNGGLLSRMGAKLWFRKDGSPRSKIKGLFIAAFAGASIYTFYAMMLLVEEFDTANYLLNSLVHIQRADVDLASVDLTDSLSVTSYFRSLCSSFDDIPPRMIEDFFREVSHLTGGSAESAHRIMRDASEDIHKILMRSKGKDPWFTGSEVIQRLDDGIGELMKLVEETMGEGDETFVSRRRQIKDRVASGKDLGSKNGNGDYELVG